MQTSAIAIQRIVRGLQFRLWYKITKYAISRVQVFFRMQKVRHWYKKVRNSIIVLQVRIVVVKTFPCGCSLFKLEKSFKKF